MFPLVSMSAACRRLYRSAGSTHGNATPATPKSRVRRFDRGLAHLLGHTALGAAVGWGVLAALVETDTCGFGSLLANAEDGAVALILLALQFGLGFATFAAVTSMAVTALGEDP